MSDIELPEPVVVRLMGDEGFSDEVGHIWAWVAHGYDTGMQPYYSADQLHSYATAMVFADREKRAQAAPYPYDSHWLIDPLWKLADKVLSKGDHEAHGLIKEAAIALMFFPNNPPTEASKPVQAEAPHVTVRLPGITAKQAQAAQPVAYLDIGSGGYVDLGSDLTPEQLQALPYGRHVLAIVGTFGVDGYVAATEASKPVQAEAPSYAPLTGRTHDLKTDSPVFSEVVAGRKLFEIRKDDRGFQCGDLLRLRETRLTGAEMAAGEPLIYTGQEKTVRVIGILRGPKYGLADGWVIMSIATKQAEAPHVTVRLPGITAKQAAAVSIALCEALVDAGREFGIVLIGEQPEAPTASNAEREVFDAWYESQPIKPFPYHVANKAFNAGFRAAIAQVPEQVAGDSVTLKQRLDELIEQHGSLRAVGRVLEFDPGYLSRLASGEKSDPGEALLRRMGLREVTGYVRAARTSGEANHG